MDKSRFKTIIAVSAIIFLTIILHFLKVLSPIEDPLKKILNSIMGTAYKTGLDTNEQSDENSCPTLEIELNEFKVDQAKLILIEEENKQLREQLNFFVDKDYIHVGAQVIGKGLEPFGSTIEINKGTKDGIATGNPVIVSGGVLIGKIIKTDSTSSIVRLLNDDESSVASTLINKDKSIGLVEGGYGISVHMNLIPQNEDVHIGDIVITSGLEGYIPRGLLIGTVETVEKEPYQPFQKAVLTPLTDLNKLFLVSVIVQS